jgi:cleavage and polyadenylation specificity factor subunit 1
MLKNGALAVYEILCSFTIPLRLSEKDGHPAVLLKKVIARQFEAVENVDAVSVVESEDHAMGRTTEIDEQISSQSRSFTSVQMDGKFKGVYLAGQPSVWLLSTDHGPCRIYDSPDGKTIHSLAQLPDGFLMSLSEPSVQDEEPSQAREPSSLWETYISEYVCLDREIPSTLVKTGRPFNKVFYDSAAEAVVAASFLETAFANFDEEGNLMWQPDGVCLAGSVREFLQSSYAS